MQVGSRFLIIKLIVVAIVTATYSMPARAQLSDAARSLANARQSSAQTAESALLRSQAEMDARPHKTWGPVQAVSAPLASAAQAFANKAPVPELQALFYRLYVEGERNATLNFQRIGLAALALGKLKLAEKAFDAAIIRIDRIYADNPEAIKARSLWSAEAIKDFKGEPYERAMTYFYRGIAYAARNDFQNARAMFKQADYQDTVAESEQFAGDFALMPYMAGWASFCDGDKNLAKDFLSQAIRADNKYENVSVENQTLVLFETGRAPFKYAAGKYGEAMKFANHNLREYPIEAVCDDTNDCDVREFIVGADVAYQATTRGGRPVDAILNGKASFKQGATKVSGTASTVGIVGVAAALQSGNRQAARVGLAGVVTGLVADSMSEATQAQADIREWEQLPKTVWLGTSKVTTVKLDTAKLSDGSEAPVALIVDTPACKLYWGRTLAPAQVSAKDAGPLGSGVHPRDPAFRADLELDFALDEPREQVAQ